MSLYTFYLVFRGLYKDNNEKDGNKKDDDPKLKPARARHDEAATYWSLAEQLRTDHSRNLLVEDPNTSDRLVIAVIDPSNPCVMENQLRSATHYATGCASESTGVKFTCSKNAMIQLLEETAQDLAFEATDDLDEEAVSSGEELAYAHESTAWPIKYQQFDICCGCGQNDHAIMHCTSASSDGLVPSCAMCNVLTHDTSECPHGGCEKVTFDDSLLLPRRGFESWFRQRMINKDSAPYYDEHGQVRELPEADGEGKNI